MKNPHLRMALIAALATVLTACGPAATPATTAPPAPTATTASPAPTTAPTAPAAEPTAAPTPAAQFAPVTLTDSLGRQVTLDAPPERIVSLAPSNTEIVFALGAGVKLIGRDEFSDYPAEALAVPSIGSLYPQVNTEVVVALKPDLVLAAGITNPDDVRALAKLGLTVYRTSIAGTLADIFADILAIGKLTGRANEAEQLVAGLNGRVDAVTAKSARLADRPKVFYEVDATDTASPWTAGPGSFIDQMLTLAGGTNVGNVGTDQYFQISLEQLVAQDPAIIILGSATYGGQTPELVATRVGWDKIAAVTAKAVYPFDDNLVSRPGPRVVDGLEMLAKLIHPDLFK